MKPGKLILLVVALVLTLPATASAATFTVNDTGDAPDDSPGNGTCATAGSACTLRAAVDEADGNTAGTNDTIKFAAALEGETITLGGFISIETELTINGGDCGDETISHRPCVGVDADNTGSDALSVNLGVNGVDIRGLAIGGATSGARGIFGGGDALTVKNSWIGFDVDGNPNANSGAVQLFGNSSVIGGTTGADRNVIGNADRGVQIIDGDSNKVRGNYIGVEPDGGTAAIIAFNGIEISGSTTGPDDATGNVIGSTVSSSAASTTKCDGGCNVIANGLTGIELGEDSGPTRAARETTIKGNFIGLDKTGAVAAENTSVGIDVADAEDTVIGGDSSRDRNFITGGTLGVFMLTPSAGGLEAKRNFIGLRSDGTDEVDPPTSGLLLRGATGTDLASRNRIAVVGGTALSVSSSGARVVRNKIGVDKGGGDVSGGFQGIRVTGGNNTIGEPDAGNTIGNTTSDAINIEGLSDDPSGDDNTVQGNFIGVDSGGASHPNDGAGILVQYNLGTANDNVIGGSSAGAENVISNSGDDAIRLVSGDMGGEAVSGNQIKRNRGKDNGTGVPAGEGLFIDLEGTNGFGNGDADVQGGIDEPEITNDFPEEATRSHLEGTCVAGATIYVFRTSSPAEFSPPRINAFVKTTACQIGGTFSTNFSQIPSGQRLTALQLDPTDGSSELAPAVDPTIENP